MGNIVDTIPFKGECCFHPILYHIYHMIVSRDSVVINLYPNFQPVIFLDWVNSGAPWWSRSLTGLDPVDLIGWMEWI